MTKSEFSEYQTIIQPIPAFYRPDSRILILGSFPSIKTRESGFFYGHPQNRFWKILSILLNEEIPLTIEAKQRLLENNRIAAWDSIYQCDIIGSSDSSIKNVVPSDLSPIFKTSSIQQVFTNGATSDKYFRKYQGKQLGRKSIRLPSTSPANAAYSLDRLLTHWQIILEYL